jgi:hypothetical protein
MRYRDEHGSMPDMRKILIKLGLVSTSLLAGIVVPGTAYAESPPGCSSVTQIGGTAHIKGNFDGETYVSVKQFKGCGKNWAYAYAWQSFVDGGAPFKLRVGVAIWGSASAHEPQSYAGIVAGGYRQQEVWSKGTNTLSNCTSAITDLDIDGELYKTQMTSIRC